MRCDTFYFVHEINGLAIKDNELILKTVRNGFVAIYLRLRHNGMSDSQDSLRVWGLFVQLPSHRIGCWFSFDQRRFAGWRPGREPYARVEPLPLADPPPKETVTPWLLRLS
jgi:hypothetical protein